MARSNAPDPILIVGAGVAGLVLAQGLRLRSIQFRLFERHPHSHPAQGHRFRISKETYKTLESSLSPPLQSLLRRTAPAINEFEPRYIDARRLEFPKPIPAGLESMPIDRAWIRSLMTEDIEDVIEYGKEFTSYQLQGNRIQAQFSDGSTARGVLLVGADGIKSRVRKDLQPTRKLQNLDRWVMWGRTPLTEYLKSSISHDLLSWCMYLDHEANVQTVVEPMIWPTSAKQESNFRLPHFPDYVYWVICAAPFQYAEALPRTAEQKRIFIERVVEPWHPSLKALLLAASHELSACVPVYSSKPDIELDSIPHSERVTIIGDAAHPMSPMGGSGGDTAIRNAVDLARTIAEQGITPESMQNFEARMGSRAKDRIEHSFRGGQKFWHGKEWTEYSEVDF